MYSDLQKTCKGEEAMDTITAVRNRILSLCGERSISINKLATICALPPSSMKNILYGKAKTPNC